MTPDTAPIFSAAQSVQDADAKAAEWEEMLAGADDKPETRVLNQDEIDALLGFTETPDPQPPKAWNDWRGQWAWMQRISMGMTLTPFEWWLEARGPKMHGNMSVKFGPVRLRLFWPWLEQWD